MEAVILAAGKGSRLAPLTDFTNKHLLPVYDKPMIYFPVTLAILAGCTKVNFVVNEGDRVFYEPLCRTLGELGVVSHVYSQNKHAIGLPSAILTLKGKINTDRMLVLLGDNMIVGQDFVSKALSAVNAKGGVHIFSKAVLRPEAYGVVIRGANGEVARLVEKPTSWVSDEAITGVYYLPTEATFDFGGSLLPSARGETEMVELLHRFMEPGCGGITCNDIGRGTVWLDAGTHSTLFSASEYVRVVQERQTQLIGSIEEAAMNKGLISRAVLLRIVENRPDSDYNRRLIYSLNKNFEI